MKLELFGMNFPHARGEFAKKIIPKHYTICLFLTPFLYEKDGELCEGNSGDILINTPGHIVYHGPRRDMTKGFENDWFYIYGNDFGVLLQRYPLPQNIAFKLSDTSFFRSIGTRIAEEARELSLGYEDKISCLITEMIIDTYRKYSQSYEKENIHDGIAEVYQAISRDPADIWSLSRMCSISGYSQSRFCELFAQRFSISPMEYVLQSRITLAKKLLCSGQASVYRTAELCGFNSVSYFSKYFKKSVGISPIQYINTKKADVPH